MKKQVIVALSLLAVIGVKGQNVYDAANIIDKDLNGTARFVGMGGAMGALGGDISTMSTNPAGIGIFRSNEASASLSYSTMGTESVYDGNTYNANKNGMTFDNIGVVFSSKIGNATALRYVNFGFNYHRVKSFNRNMTMNGLMYGDSRGRMSQARQMAEMANESDANIDFGSNDIFDNPLAGWLPALGWNGHLIDFDKNVGLYYPVIPSDPYVKFNSWERGGIDQYDFNLSFNISDRVYLGMTIGAYDVDYNKHTLYDEDYGNEEGYSLESWNRVSGAGFDFKFGTIIRPFEYSPFRIGLAIHTPTFYNLTYATSARLVSDVFLDNNPTTSQIVINTQDKVNGDLKREFRLISPWKYNVSLGYTIGKALAIGAEYEYQDYSSMKFEESDGYRMEAETAEAKYVTKGVSTFRVGAEYKVIPEFAFRLGYNYTSAIFKDDAIKALPINSMQTDTDFSNTKSRNDFTLGVGYRGSMFYADLAYKLTTYKSDFYPFYNDFYTSSGQYDATVVPNATKVTNTRSQVLLTLGLRF